MFVHEIFVATMLNLSYCLDWFICENPVLLMGGSTGLIITDMLLAVWGSKFVVRSNTQQNLSDILWELSDHEGDAYEDGWKLHLTNYFLTTLQSYPVRFAEWYDKAYLFDELNHFPVLTCPIVGLILFYSCKLMWEGKPQQLIKHELIIEETLLKDAITKEFETYLHATISKIGDFKEVMAANSRLLAHSITKIKKLLSQVTALDAQVEELRDSSFTQRKRLEAYMTENKKLHRENDNLQTHVNELQLSNNAQVHQEDMQTLNAELITTKNENNDLHRQNVDLQKEINYLREAISTADAKMTEAENTKEMATIEQAKFRGEAERLIQENINLQQAYQQLLENNQLLTQEKTAAEDSVKNIEPMIHNINRTALAAQEKYQFLEKKMAEMETTANANIQRADVIIQSLQSDIAAMDAEHNLKLMELDMMKAREEHIKKENKKRAVQQRKVHRLGQKKLVNMKRTFMNIQQRLHEDLASVQRDNQRLEHRLASLDPSVQGQTQVIHDPHKDNEVRKMKSLLQQQRSKNILLDIEVKRLNELLDEYRKRFAAGAAAAKAAKAAKEAKEAKEAAPEPAQG